MDTDSERPRGRRGFAAMDPERRREIARKGAGGCAVLLQSVNADGSPGAILGAAIVREM